MAESTVDEPQIGEKFGTSVVFSNERTSFKYVLNDN
jgi:hypothetical protein